MTKKTWGGTRLGAGRPIGNNFDLVRAKELADNGKSLREVAQELNSSYAAIWQAFKKEGWITPRISRLEKNYNWNLILEKGMTTIQETGRSLRRYIYYQGRVHIYARVLWNVHNPKNLATVSDIIHHEDLNTLNDVITNYKKVTRKEHQDLHKKKR
jgi:hypothetical protein